MGESERGETDRTEQGPRAPVNAAAPAIATELATPQAEEVMLGLLKTPGLRRHEKKTERTAEWLFRKQLKRRNASPP